jgi:RNA polymerase sigma-70 factor (ECF subfamily)
VARTEELYARHGRLVSGLCQALLRDRAEAEDAAQQTFLAVHRALLNGSSPREPAAWLATIARNECWSRIRARMREPLPSAELDAESRAADPLTQAIRRADLAALWRAIADLPGPQRDALLLREFGGLTYDELAQALSVTGPAVESLLFRARQGLRARLQTVYAAVSGASWIEALARALSGASGSAAPVAAKAVVVAGVGAAVLTGGGAVTPNALQHHRASAHRPVSSVTRPGPTAPAPVLALRSPAAQDVVRATRAARRDDPPSSGDRSSGSGDERLRATPRTTDGEHGDAAAQPAGNDGEVTVPTPDPSLTVVDTSANTPDGGN